MKGLFVVACIVTAIPTVGFANSFRYHKLHTNHHANTVKEPVDRIYELSRSHLDPALFESHLNPDLATTDDKPYQIKDDISGNYYSVHKKSSEIVKINDVVTKTYHTSDLKVIDGFKDFSAAQRREATCLALTIYHEARGSTVEDQKATAFVVLNRLHTDSGNAFGHTVCQVVSQRRVGASHLQFPWMEMSADSLVPKEPIAWTKAQQITVQLLDSRNKDITNGSLYFWCPKKALKGSWMTKGISYKHIGSHVYMKTAEYTN